MPIDTAKRGAAEDIGQDSTAVEPISRRTSWEEEVQFLFRDLKSFDSEVASFETDLEDFFFCELSSLDSELASYKKDLEDFLTPVEVEPVAASAPASASSRLVALERLKGAERGPYYPRLAQLVAGAGEEEWMLRFLDPLLHDDLAEIGRRPKQDGPLVSVVMPVWNGTELLREAAYSVLAQTHQNFELLICDDASTDGTPEIITGLKDERIVPLRHDEQKGAAAARNTCLKAAGGRWVAYLDADNIWHPRYLERMLAALAGHPGRRTAFGRFFDILKRGSEVSFSKVATTPFSLESQIETPFVDLNSYIHDRILHATLGGFDETLKRRQDYDLISRYNWLEDPVEVSQPMNLYQRFSDRSTITSRSRDDTYSKPRIQSKIDDRYQDGLRLEFPDHIRKVSVVSWDMSRNHFAKAFSVAEALSSVVEVELVSFRFFNEPIFPPLAAATPPFKTRFYDGCDFPEFFEAMTCALAGMDSDLVYAVKPRLPSLGLALLDNFHRGTPVMLEVNDLETVVTAPRARDRHLTAPLSTLASAPAGAVSPHDTYWSQLLDPIAEQVPVLFSHNQNLDAHYGRRTHRLRNIKDASVYNPDEIDRDAVRRELGLKPNEKVILFGGLVRGHKGVFEIVDLVRNLSSLNVRLVVAGNRENHDLQLLRERAGDTAVFLPPQPPAMMAKLNYAADLVLLWLDPSVPATHYQMPYKLTDALAMGAAVVGSPVSDLALLETSGVVETVAFGDTDGLQQKVRRLLEEDGLREARQRTGRKLFMRQFSYPAVRDAVALAAHSLPRQRECYDFSIAFADAFAEFRRRFEGRV